MSSKIPHKQIPHVHLDSECFIQPLSFIHTDLWMTKNDPTYGQQDVEQNSNPHGHQASHWRPPCLSFNSAQMSVDIFLSELSNCLRNLNKEQQNTPQACYACFNTQWGSDETSSDRSFGPAYSSVKHSYVRGFKLISWSLCGSQHGLLESCVRGGSIDVCVQICLHACPFPIRRADP